MKEYTVKFVSADDTVNERKYRLINVSTMKARSIVMKFFKVSGTEVEFDSNALASLTATESSFNDLMSNILVGDHKNVNWFEADSTQCDEIIKDFFTSFGERTKLSN